MRYQAEDIFKDFVREVLPKEYSGIPNNILKNICFTPFMFVRKVMQSNVLTEIRLKYFGIFMVSPGKSKTMLEKAEIRHSKGLIDDEEFYEIKNMVNNFFNSLR